MNAMRELGDALRDRMGSSRDASLTITKRGKAWRVAYRDEHGYAEATALRAEGAALSVAEALGLVR